jgi:hypothetical protein
MSHIAEVRMSVASPYRPIFRQALAAGVLLMASAASQAFVPLDLGSYTLFYDETTVFGDPTTTSGPGGAVSFSWTIPNTVSAVSIGDTPVSSTFTLPTFAVFADPGFKLSGPISASFGNLVFTEVGASATTSATISGGIFLNADPVQAIGTALTQVSTSTVPGVYNAGYFGTSGSLPLGEFTYFAFGGSLTLTANGGILGSAVTVAQPQNHLTVSLVAMPVPEPETWALMLGGLLMVGQRLRRRTPR